MARCKEYMKDEFACVRCQIPFEQCPYEVDARRSEKSKEERQAEARAKKKEYMVGYCKEYSQKPDVKARNKIKNRRFARMTRIANGQSRVFGQVELDGKKVDVYKGRGEFSFYYFIGLKYFESDGRDLVGKWVSYGSA